MIREDLIGKYWLCGNSKGKWLVQGNKPRHFMGGYEADFRDDNDMRWLSLTCGSRTWKGEVAVKDSDFEGLNFPELSPENDILEIEICKSGKVYWYES